MREPLDRPRMGGLGHPAAYALAAAVAFALSALAALPRPVPEWELDLTSRINDAPDVVADVLFPFMQMGTALAPLGVAAAIVVFRRDWLLAGATVAAGWAAWFGAKAIKLWIERPRPFAFLPDIDVREGMGTGLGFPSGHGAVAATIAVMGTAALPKPARPVLAVVALIVGLARIVYGLHFPADVVGGWSFGVLVGLGGLWSVDRVHDRVVGARPEPVTP